MPSPHEIIVEYGVQEMMKGKTPSSAAKYTADHFSGSTNLFIHGGTEVLKIDADELEAALWNRMVENVVRNLQGGKPGYEHYALDGAMIHFGQFEVSSKKPSKAALGRRQILKTMVMQALGTNPFTSDDK